MSKSSIGFDYDALEALRADLAEAADKFPQTAEKHLIHAANTYKRMLADASPTSGINHKRKIRDSWKSEIKGYSGSALEANIWSNSPHFHLVNRGHRIVTPGGKVLGFKQGTFFLETTTDNYEANVHEDEMEKLLKDLLKQIEK